jgi:predicted MFS family arabinose efflux permease
MNRRSQSLNPAQWIIFALALGAGFSVAAIYYAQPLLPLMGSDLHLTVNGMGLVPTLTQAGYALGILFYCRWATATIVVILFLRKAWRWLYCCWPVA